MATGKGDKSFNSTLSMGSEEIFDFVCYPCSTEDIHLEAVGFCGTCGEYLCQTCYKCHSKQSATKTHKLLDKSSMPKSKGGSNISKTKVAANVTDVLTETCPKHRDKLLEYICRKHDELCCVVCITLNHAQCQNKSYVPDVSDNVIKSDEYKCLHADLDRLVSMATGYHKLANAAGLKNDEYQSKCLSKIKSLRVQIDKMLDKIQTKAEQNVTGLHKENMDKVTKTSAECQTIISELQAMISNLKSKERDGKINQLFVDFKLSNENISRLEGQLQTMNDWHIKRYDIAENQKLQELESTLSEMLSLQQNRPVTRARYQKQINVMSDEDREDCGINGIAVLERGRVVVTDGLNEAVKLIDVMKNKVVSRVSVSSYPFHVTQTEPNKVAVTLDNNTIVLFAVSDVLSKIKFIQVPNTNMYGLCSYQDNMIVVCRDPSCLKVINMYGQVLKTLDKNKDGDLLVSTPSRIAVYGGLLHVTDPWANSVTTLTLDGQIVTVYKNDNLEDPVGATVGRCGEVFACSRKTHSIHQLSPTGQYVQILLGQDQKLADWPFAIAHSDHDNKLYISSSSTDPELSNYIRVFQLE